MRALHLDAFRVGNSTGGLLDDLEDIEKLQHLTLPSSYEEQKDYLRLLPNVYTITLDDPYHTRAEGV